MHLANWATYLSAASPLSVVAAAWIGRKYGRRAVVADERSAAAQQLDAQAHANEARVAEWNAYTSQVYRWGTSLQARVDTLEQRVTTAEKEGRAASARAEKSEGLYKVAVDYVRRVVDWIQETFPGAEIPPHPKELDGEL